MKTFGICSAFTVVGFAIAFGLYMTGGMALLNYLQKQGGGSPESYLGVAFMAVFPICLAVGSFVSGYSCQPYIQKSYLYLLISPGIYAAIYVILTSGGTIPGYLEFLLISSAIWICSSIIAAYIGKYFRAKRIANNQL